MMKSIAFAVLITYLGFCNAQNLFSEQERSLNDFLQSYSFESKIKPGHQKIDPNLNKVKIAAIYGLLEIGVKENIEFTFITNAFATEESIPGGHYYEIYTIAKSNPNHPDYELVHMTVGVSAGYQYSLACFEFPLKKELPPFVAP